MDNSEWERAMMQGHPFANPYFPRPKLEIPNTEPATPRRRGTSAQSPRGIYDFPISPQSPGDGIILSPTMKPPSMRPIPRPPWVQDSIDQVPMCAPSSPGSNHPGHGFGDCNAECSSSSRNSCYRSPVPPSSNLPLLDLGDIVLVRCNQTKWLGGQVKRISNTGVKVWIGAAETLVDVPVELFPTHLARLGCTTPCSSPRDCHSTGSPVIKVRVPCVRPAHLSHRHLYQIISPESSVANSPSSQMHQAQCTSPAPKDPRMTSRYCHYVSPPPDQRPSNVPDHVEAFFEKKKGPIPPPPGRSILKRSGSTAEPLNTVREDSKLMSVKLDGRRGLSDLQDHTQTQAQAQAQALSQFRSKFHVQAQAQAEAQSQFHVQAQAQAYLQAHLQALAQAQIEAQAQAQIEAQAQAQFEAQAQAQYEAQAQAQFEAQAQAQIEAQAQAQFEDQAQAQYEAQAQAQFEAQAQAQIEAQAQAQIEAQAQAQFEAQAQAQYEAQAQAQFEAQAHAQYEAQAQAQFEAQARAQAHIQAQALAQAQFCWRQHLARSNQQGNRPSYPRPSELPMLNVNLNEGTSSGSLYVSKGTHIANAFPVDHMYNINPESLEEDLFELPLLKPQYEQFVTPQSLTRTAELLSTESPKRPPTASVKGKERCEEEACSKWAQGTDLLQLSRSSQGMPLERSVSLDSYQSPALPGLIRSPGATPAKSATFSADPVWVTVIDNGHGRTGRNSQAFSNFWPKSVHGCTRWDVSRRGQKQGSAFMFD